MPAGVGSSFSTVAAGIKAAFDAEFAAEGFVMRFDNLHGSLGLQRVDVGIAPVEDVPNSRNKVALETWVEVKFYDAWTKKWGASPEIVVNPERITEFAERFRRCLRESGVHDPGTNETWYYDVERVRYPNDPTGNKTRFVATIRAFGDNTGLIETRG